MDLASSGLCTFRFVDCSILAQLSKRKPVTKRNVRFLAQPHLFVLDFVYSAIALADSEQLAVFTFGGCNVHCHTDICKRGRGAIAEGFWKTIC